MLQCCQRAVCFAPGVHLLDQKISETALIRFMPIFQPCHQHLEVEFAECHKTVDLLLIVRPTLRIPLVLKPAMGNPHFSLVNIIDRWRMFPRHNVLCLLQFQPMQEIIASILIIIQFLKDKQWNIIPYVFKTTKIRVLYRISSIHHVRETSQNIWNHQALFEKTKWNTRNHQESTLKPAASNSSQELFYGGLRKQNILASVIIQLDHDIPWLSSMGIPGS